MCNGMLIAAVQMEKAVLCASREWFGFLALFLGVPFGTRAFPPVRKGLSVYLYLLLHAADKAIYRAVPALFQTIWKQNRSHLPLM